MKKKQIRQAILSLDAEGEHRSDEQIAEQHDVTKQYVSEIRCDLAYDGKLTTTDYLPDSQKKHKARCLLASEESLSQASVAKRVGLSRRTIGKIERQLDDTDRGSFGDQTLIRADMSTYDYEPESYDLVLTDPPYPKEYLPLWSDLSEVASEVLKPSGFVVALAGKRHLPKEIERLGEHLDWYWTLSIPYEDGRKIEPNTKAVSTFRQVLVYQKPPYRNDKTTFQDTIEGSEREKNRENWQQSTRAFEELLDRFTEPGDRVLDPFMGTGSTLVACRSMGRHGTGIEIEEDRYQVARNWLRDETEPSKPLTMSFGTGI